MQKKGIKQHDLRDCGAACLATILLRYGAKIPLVKVREMMKVDKNGSSIYAITQAAHELHLHADALKGDLEEFQDAVNKGEFRLPVIAHLIVEGTLAHYVVVEQLKENKVVVFDPAKGKCTYTLQDLTTLLHLLASFYPASCGRIILGGVDFQNIPLKLLRKNIIYVSQNSTLFSGSLRENLLFGSKNGNEAKLQEVIEGCQIKEIIDKLPFGLDTVISENGKSLSGGEKQRIALGRALLSEPEMLLLDESTSHLDIQTEKKVIDFIEHWCEDITCIMVTHKLSVIKRCEKVVFMKGGRVIGTGTHEELLQKK